MSAANVTLTINTTATRTPLIAGVDVSSRVLAVVLLHAHSGALHETLELKIKPGGVGPTMPQASAFRVAAATIGKAQHVWIEDPMGAHARSIAAGSRAVGALIAALPVRDEWITLVPPPKWKKLSGLKGNAAKPAIKTHALSLYPELGDSSQDIADAACIARAGFNADTANRLAEGS